MATITLRGYARGRDGAGIPGATVSAYAVNTDGSKAGTATKTTTPNALTGKWELTDLNTNASQTGTFAVILTYGAEQRVIEPDVILQVSKIIGAHGVAPLDNNSITDALIGSRTINSTTRVTSNNAELTSYLNGFAYMLKTITGKTNWYDLPATTLQEAYTHGITQGNPHNTTAAQVGALATSYGVTRVAAGLDSARTSHVAGTLYISTDTDEIWYRNGSTWDKIAAGV